MSNFSYSVLTLFPNGVSLDSLNNSIKSTLSLESLSNTTVTNGQITFTFTDEIVENNLIIVLQNHVPDSLPFYLCYQNVGNWTIGNLLTYLADFGATSLNLDNYAFIQFANEIPTKSNIDTAIANYVEPPVITAVNVLKSSNENYITTDIGDILKSVNPQELIVAQNGRGQYSTIYSAIAAIPTNEAYTISVFPGTYVENQLILPRFCSLKSEGNAANTIVVAVNPSIPLLKVGESNLVENFTFVGGIEHDGSVAGAQTLINKCKFGECKIYVHGGYGDLIMSICGLRNTTDITAVEVNGGSIVFDNVTLTSDTPVNKTNKGIYVYNAGVITANNISVYDYNNAVVMKNAAVFRSTLVNIVGCNNGLCTETPDIEYLETINETVFGTLNIKNSTIYDLNLAGLTKTQYLNSSLDDGKINNPSNSVINANIQNFRNNFGYQIISGNIFAGTEAIPSTLAIGKNTNTNNMFCYFYDEVNYVDESVLLRDPTDPPLTLTNQSIFLCHNTNIIYGFDIYTTLTNNPGIYYYNGSAWVSLNYSVYDINSGSFVSTIAGSSSIYFDADYSPQQVNINGKSAFWIKIVPSNTDITHITLHSNVTTFNNDGKRKSFAKARCKKLVNLPQNIINSNLYFSMPFDFDYSTKYTISVYADANIMLNNVQYNTTMASASVYGDLELQQMPISAVNIKNITLSYLSV